MKEYLDKITQLLAENKTTGNDHSEEMLHYTKMNLSRMKRWESKGEILEETKNAIKNICEKQEWIVLTEAWCGDAAHSISFISKMAALNPKINFKIKLRDENLDLIDQYLTNGGRSIPKLIVRDENGKDVFNWGPRPAKIQSKYLEMKANNETYEQISLETQKMYNDDKGVTIQKEIIAKLNN